MRLTSSPQITLPFDLFRRTLLILAGGASAPVRIPAGRRWESADGPPEVIAARIDVPGGAQLWIDLVERFYPPQAESLPDSCIAVLEVGRGIRRGRARGWVRDGGGRWQVARIIYLPGPRLLQIPLGPAAGLMDAPIAAESAERWSRTRAALGADAHDRLRALTIGIVGLGRTGSILARNLVGLGISRLVIVDPDSVEPHNLGEGDFYTPDAIGQPKVHAWENWLALHGGASLPEIYVEAVAESAAHARSIAALGRCHVIFSASDNAAARIEAAAIATAYGRPLIDLGTRVLTRSNTGSDPTMGADIRLVLDRCLLCFGGVAGAAGGEDPLLTIASPDRERTLRLERNALDERAGSLHSLNQLAAATAIRLLEDTVLGRADASRWVRIEFASDARIAVRYPEPAPHVGTCLCPISGAGDAGLSQVLLLLGRKSGN